MQPRVNKWLDLLDRAGWTAIQAAAAAGIVYLTSGEDIGWQEALTFIGVATAVAVLKVLVGQNTGADDTGSLIGQSVVDPAPIAKSSP